MEKTIQPKTRKLKRMENVEIKEKIEPSIQANQTEQTGQPNQTVWRKIIEVCFCLLAVLTPLFFLPLTIAPAEINKQIFAGILIAVAFVCYLIDSFEKRKIIYPKSPIVLAVLALLTVLAAGTFFSKAKEISLYGNLTQPDSLLSFLIYGLAFFLAGVYFNREELTNRAERSFRALANCFFIGLALTAIFGLLQIFGKFILPWDFARQTSFNPIGTILSWGIYLAAGLAIIIASLCGRDKGEIGQKGRIGLAALGFLIIAELVLVNYSSLWLALTLVVLFLAAYQFIAISKLNSVLIILVSFFLFFSFVGSSLPSLVSLPMEIRPSLSSTWTVISGPIKDMGKTGLSGEIWRRGVIGSGPATFGYNYALYRPLELNQTNFWSFRFNQGFSFLTTFLATGGILGILAVLLIVMGLIKAINSINLRDEEEKMKGQTRREGMEILTVSTGAIFLLLALIFAPISLTQALFIFMGLGLITALTAERGEIFLGNFFGPKNRKGAEGLERIEGTEQTDEQEFEEKNKMKITGGALGKIKALIVLVVLIALISGSFVLAFYLGKKYLAAVYYEKGLRVYNQTGDLDKTLAKVDRARQFDPNQDQYLRTFGQLLFLKADQLIGQQGVMAGKPLTVEIQNILSNAIEISRQAARINPVDSLNWSNLADIYEKIIPLSLTAESFAEENYKKAAELDPKNPQESVNIARTFLTSVDSIGSGDANLRQEKLNKAKNYLEMSLGLKSDYAPAHFLLAAAAMREGKTQEAINRLEFIKNSYPSDSGLAFQLGLIYYQNNQFDQARGELARAIAINPNYSNARYFLGLIYDRSGDRTAAQEQFEKIAQLNPDNEEIKKILDNLKEGRSALDGIVPPAQPPAERLEAPVQEQEKEKQTIKEIK